MADMVTLRHKNLKDGKEPRQITVPVSAARVLEKSDWTRSESADGTGEPPRSGSGSGRDAWAEYASTVGIEPTDDMNRDDIIAAVDAAKSEGK